MGGVLETRTALWSKHPFIAAGYVNSSSRLTVMISDQCAALADRDEEGFGRKLFMTALSLAGLAILCWRSVGERTSTTSRGGVSEYFRGMVSSV